VVALDLTICKCTIAGPAGKMKIMADKVGAMVGRQQGVSVPGILKKQSALESVQFAFKK